MHHFPEKREKKNNAPYVQMIKSEESIIHVRFVMYVGRLALPLFRNFSPITALFFFSYSIVSFPWLLVSVQVVLIHTRRYS